MSNCTSIQKSLAWCQGTPEYPGIKRRIYYIAKSAIAKWPTLPTDDLGRPTSAIYGGKLHLDSRPKVALHRCVAGQVSGNLGSARGVALADAVEQTDRRPPGRRGGSERGSRLYQQHGQRVPCGGYERQVPRHRFGALGHEVHRSARPRSGRDRHRLHHYQRRSLGCSARSVLHRHDRTGRRHDYQRARCLNTQTDEPD